MWNLLLVLCGPQVFASYFLVPWNRITDNRADSVRVEKWSAVVWRTQGISKCKKKAIHLTVSKQSHPSVFAISPVLEAMGKGPAHTPYSSRQVCTSGGGGHCVVLAEASPTAGKRCSG